MKKVTYEEFEKLAKEDFRKQYEGRRPMDEVNDYLEDDSEVKDAIEGGYKTYISRGCSEWQTPEDHLNSCVAMVSYNMSLCF